MEAGLIGSKLGAMFLLAIVGGVGAIISIACKILMFKTAMELSNAFAAGAFISLGLFHILPDAIDSFVNVDYIIHFKNTQYNLVYLVVFLGFFIIFVFEFIVIDPATKNKEPDFDSENIIADNKNENSSTNGYISQSICSNQGDFPLRDLSNMSIVISVKDEQQINNPKNKGLFASGAIFLMLALTVHGFFEGVVVGTRSLISGVWLTTLVIVGHKWAESFAMMSQFINQNISRKVSIILLSIFIFSSPIGAAVGIILTDVEAASGICNALGVGTIIFVSFEIIFDVFNQGGPLRWWKCFVFFIGSLVVFGLTVLEHAVESMLHVD